MPYVPRNLRVEFYCKVCKSLSQGSFSVCSFMNHTLYVRIKRDVCNSSHQIETIKEPSSDTTRWWVCKHATNLRIYVCLALGNMKNPFESFMMLSDSKLSKNFRTSNLPLKDLSLRHIKLTNFFSKRKADSLQSVKGG